MLTIKHNWLGLNHLCSKICLNASWIFIYFMLFTFPIMPMLGSNMHYNYCFQRLFGILLYECSIEVFQYHIAQSFSLGEFCFTMIGRANIEESKSNISKIFDECMVRKFSSPKFYMLKIYVMSFISWVHGIQSFLVCSIHQSFFLSNFCTVW